MKTAVSTKFKSIAEAADEALDDPRDDAPADVDAELGSSEPVGDESEPESMDAPLDDGADSLSPGEDTDLPPEGESDAPVSDPGAGAITGKFNSSPVGDIKMSKVKGSYNTYKLEMSMGQLEVIKAALERNHADPVADELLATLSFYMDSLPGPGEDEEASDAKKDGPSEDSEIPMPPGTQPGGTSAGDVAKLPPPPPSPREKLTQGSKPQSKKPERPGLPDFDEEDTDKLPPPPAE